MKHSEEELRSMHASHVCLQKVPRDFLSPVLWSANAQHMTPVAWSLINLGVIELDVERTEENRKCIDRWIASGD